MRRERRYALSALVCFVFFGSSAIESSVQKKPKHIYVLKGGPLGGVKLQHKLHGEGRGIKCETCHHPSKPQKPAAEPQQACSTCHVTPAKPPMKTNKMLAFHNPPATAGTCITCHKAENAKGKKAPVKCVDCHKKGVA